MTEKKKILIAGGGASGMMAALAAAGEGAEVTLLEQNDCLGKKILSTGNGRCNFTNMKQEPSCYRGEDPDLPGGRWAGSPLWKPLLFLRTWASIPGTGKGAFIPIPGRPRRYGKCLLPRCRRKESGC